MNAIKKAVIPMDGGLFVQFTQKIKEASMKLTAEKRLDTIENIW